MYITIQPFTFQFNCNIPIAKITINMIMVSSKGVSCGSVNKMPRSGTRGRKCARCWWQKVFKHGDMSHEIWKVLSNTSTSVKSAQTCLSQYGKRVIFGRTQTFKCFLG